MIAGKKILFFSPSFFGYENRIKEKLILLGAKVDLFDLRYSNLTIDKILMRKFPKVVSKKTHRYHENILHSVGNDYDYVFVIKGELLDEYIMKKMKEKYSGATFILYLYDSILNLRNFSRIEKYFDLKFSFDRSDCLKTDGFIFRPLFYLDEYTRSEIVNKDSMYDISFIGTIHSDRLRIIKMVDEEISKYSLKSYFYMYLQSRILYYGYCLVSRQFRNEKASNFKYLPLPHLEISRVIEMSKCILDIHHPKQSGLTMRTIEMLGMKKKLITTNKDIINYDFYNPSNILVVNREKIEIKHDFFLTPFVDIDDSIYKKYCLENWLHDIFI